VIAPRKNIFIGMFELTKRVLTDQHPDCLVHWKDEVVFGTYQLDSESQNKSGSVQFLERGHKIPLESGVLDLKAHKDYLVGCTSRGSLFSTDQENLLSEMQVHSSCASMVSLRDSTCFVSFLDGSIATVDLNLQTVTSLQKVNPYEIWSVHNDQDLLFVPKFMGRLEIRDVRIESSIKTIEKHTQDICSISTQENLLMTGSFDEGLCLSDLRNFKTIERVEFTGGVWRHHRTQKGIAAACMQSGFQFFSEGKLECYPTSSLAYGLEVLAEEFIVCSFYSSELLFVGLSKT